MSDTYIRLIPTDRDWQPTPASATSATAYVAALLSGRDHDVERVESTFYDQVTLIDAGMYTTRITCPHCDEEIPMGWLGDLVRQNGGVSFDHLDVTAPCCTAATELDMLHYENPIGFARFEISAMNTTRFEDELDVGELAQVAHFLGHPVTQIIAHY